MVPSVAVGPAAPSLSVSQRDPAVSGARSGVLGEPGVGDERLGSAPGLPLHIWILIQFKYNLWNTF